MTTSATRQEQRVVTQEVRATSTVLANDSQVKFTYNLIGNETRNQFIHGRVLFTDKVLLFWTSEMNSLLNESKYLWLIQINHQPYATIFQFIILTFIYSLTRIGRFPAHHQELDCSGGLWFYLRIVVTVMLCSWSGRL